MYFSTETVGTIMLDLPWLVCITVGMYRLYILLVYLCNLFSSGSLGSGPRQPLRVWDCAVWSVVQHRKCKPDELPSDSQDWPYEEEDVDWQALNQQLHGDTQ